MIKACRSIVGPPMLKQLAPHTSLKSLLATGWIKATTYRVRWQRGSPHFNQWAPHITEFIALHVYRMRRGSQLLLSNRASARLGLCQLFSWFPFLHDAFFLHFAASQCTGRKNDDVWDISLEKWSKRVLSAAEKGCHKITFSPYSGCKNRNTLRWTIVTIWALWLAPYQYNEASK